MFWAIALFSMKLRNNFLHYQFFYITPFIMEWLMEVYKYSRIVILKYDFHILE